MYQTTHPLMTADSTQVLITTNFSACIGCHCGVRKRFRTRLKVKGKGKISGQVGGLVYEIHLRK